MEMLANVGDTWRASLHLNQVSAGKFCVSISSSATGRDFGERHYDDLSQIIRPSLLYDALVRTYPALATGTYEVQLINFDEQVLLRQFAAIYRGRVAAGTKG